MTDRLDIRPFSGKVDYRLQSLITSPYVQQQLKLTELANQRNQILSINNCLRSLSRRKRQRREREAITQEIVSRAIKIDQSHQRSRRHQFEIAARRVVDNNFDILSRQHKKQSHAQKKTREKSAPTYLNKTDSDGERRQRVTSVNNRRSKTDYYAAETASQEGNRFEHINKFNMISVERHACEMTMCYRSAVTTTKPEKLTQDEIVVMQQHSNGENLVVYRGFLSKGESFSFKSQRRPTSSLSLAFYTKGFIDSVVNDCCEFRYGRRSHQLNEYSQFTVERVRKASPCEKCRKRYAQKMITLNSNTQSPEVQSEKLRRRFVTPTLKLTDDNQSETTKVTSTNEHIDRARQLTTNEHKSKRVSSGKKPIVRQRSDSIDFGLLESALSQKQTRSIPIESSNASRIEEKTSLLSTEGEEHVQQWIDHTDTIPWENSSTTTSVLDHGTTLPFSVVDQEHQQMNTTASSPMNILRNEKNVENYIYILDGHISISNKQKRKLRGLINYGVVFDDINEKPCIEFIEKVVHEQIFLILSKTSMKHLDMTIRNACQVRLIYIIDNTNEVLNDCEKIRGIYPNLTSAFEQIEKDMKILLNKYSTIFSTSLKDEACDNLFTYVQVLKDILLEVDDANDLKKEMLDFCRKEYIGNSIQLKYIDEFETEFRPDQAVRWYRRQETFVFKMLARACRTLEADILYKLRFFIQQLNRQLKSNCSNTSMTVYRKQFISQEDFNNLQMNSNTFLCFSSFIGMTKSKMISEKKSQTKLFNTNDYRLILFEIDINTALPHMINDSNSDEILVTFASTFRILTIEQVEQDVIKIKLLFDDDVARHIYDLTRSLREIARESFPLLRIAKLMKHMEYMYYTEYFCLMLMNNPLTIKNEPANLVLGGLFHTLCSFYYEQEQYDRALEQLEKSLKVYQRVLPPDDIKLTPTYNNMGSIYHKKGLDKQALQYHKKAYDIQIKSVNPDLDSVAAYAGNIASVLIKQNKFEEAIPYLQRDLQIRQRLYPNEDDINLAVKYHNLAGAQFRLNKYAEALDNYRKCLEIELKIHPTTHPTVAVTYYNMATTLEGLGQLDEAIQMVQKAVKRLLITRDDNDEEVKMHRDYEKRLEQKLWVKSLFGTN